MSLLHGRLPEYPIAQRFLEIGFEISACANSVYQAFLLPLLKRLGTRLASCIQWSSMNFICTFKLYSVSRIQTQTVSFQSL